jgi:hypothetical protein
MPKPPLDPALLEFTRSLARLHAKEDAAAAVATPPKPLDPELREFVKALAEKHADEEWERMVHGKDKDG